MRLPSIDRPSCPPVTAAAGLHRVREATRGLLRTLLHLVMALAWAAFAWAAWVPAAAAGTLDRAALQRLFPAPLTVGERDAALPVWPVFKQEATATVLVGYLFESIDLAPVPGFSGTPVNLLVALDAQGGFTDVRVLSHHEPVFLDGLGEEPLLRFVAQYHGLSLKQNIKIGTAQTQGDRAQSANVYVDGVAKATASVRIVHQSLLAAALKVARAKLGYAEGRDPDRVGRVREGPFAPLDFEALQRQGLVRHVRVPRREVEQAFAGTVGEGLGGRGDEGDFVELWLAYLNLPLVGRNLLDQRGWQQLTGRLQGGDHALLVIGRGDWSFVGEHFVRGAVPDRLTLRQGQLPIELRDLDLDAPLRLPPALAGTGVESKVFRVIGPAGLDPSEPMSFGLRVTRSRGMLYAERVSRDFTLPFALPPEHVIAPPRELTGWQAAWAGQWRSLAVIALALAGLGVLLARPAWLVADPRRLAWARSGFLVFTLVFIGWIAQGQLSIVQLTAVVRALREGRDLGFVLYDPVSLLLWVVVAVTLLVWGRGTFCGWLCPFGALQELVSQAARRLGLKPRTLHRRTDARLKRVKYAVLALLLGTALVSGPWTDRLVEFEPFKTAITLGFVREWPFVLWAVALVLLSAVVYKGYCRYLCPLGAALALGGRLRRFGWIARRAECGTPCQTCRHRCGYQAIRPDGRVHYAECFQCLDCVAIHASDTLCAPRIAQRRGRVIPIQPVTAEVAA